MEFSRGDPAYHFFYIPVTSWSAGGKLFFAAKPNIDDVTDDSTAVIKGSWDDTKLLPNETIKGIVYKKYECTFPPEATNSIVSNGQDSAEYLGEFQWVNSNGIPFTYPAKDPKIEVTLYFDVKRGTS